MVRIGGVGMTMMLMGLGVSPHSLAQQSVLSPAGFTGLSITPTANLLPWGTASVSYDNEVVNGPTVGRSYARYGTSGHNFAVGFGLLPNLEISGRLATNKIQANCYFVEGCGIRDLSFNMKGGVTLDDKGFFKVAVGANDFGGQFNFFRTVYGVATFSQESYYISAGYARSSKGLVGGALPLTGGFASAAYRPMPWLQTHIEYNRGASWIGARVFAPAEWLPAGWAASIGVTTKLSGGSEQLSKNWMGLNLSVPLYKVPETRVIGYASTRISTPNFDSTSEDVPKRTALAFNSDGIPASYSAINEIGEIPVGLAPRSEAIKNLVENASLEKMARSLSEKGYEDISVGRTQSGDVAISINNSTYNVNTLDAVGVALGVLARTLGKEDVGYRLVLNQRQLPVVGVTGRTGCLLDWIALRQSNCVAGILHTPGLGNVSDLVDDSTWVVQNLNPSWSTFRVIAQPVLRTGVATEYGVLDYSAGIRLTGQLPLWAGAYVELSRVEPVKNSRDYDAGRVFGAEALTSVTDKILFHQIVRLPLEKLFGEYSEKASKWGASAVTAHFAAGKINEDYRGTYGELRWEPFAGMHRLGIEAGSFERITAFDYYLPKKSRPILASYRYRYAPTSTDFELAGGQFLHNDRGAQLLMTQWFDDVALNIYLRRTSFEYERGSRTFAGVEIVLPLTPRKDMNPTSHIQVTGAPRWSYGVETRVGQSNYISVGQGIFPGVAVLDRTFNSDRGGADYFERNMARIRSAAEK